VRRPPPRMMRHGVGRPAARVRVRRPPPRMVRHGGDHPDAREQVRRPAPRMVRHTGGRPSVREQVRRPPPRVMWHDGGSRRRRQVRRPPPLLSWHSGGRCQTQQVRHLSFRGTAAAAAEHNKCGGRRRPWCRVAADAAAGEHVRRPPPRMVRHGGGRPSVREQVRRPPPRVMWHDGGHRRKQQVQWPPPRMVWRGGGRCFRGTLAAAAVAVPGVEWWRPPPRTDDDGVRGGLRYGGRPRKGFHLRSTLTTAATAARPIPEP